MKKKTLICIASIFAIVVCAKYIHAENIPNQSGKVKIEKDFDDKFWNYTKSMAPLGIFNGGKTDGNLVQTAPFQLSPFSNFQLQINQKNSQSYARGEELSVNYSITYLNQAKSELDKYPIECKKELQKFQEKIDKEKEKISKDPKEIEYYQNTKEKIENNSDNSEISNNSPCPQPDIYSVDPISNVGIYIQIWKKDPNKENALKGDYLIDEFYTANNLSFSNNETKNLNLKWKIPKDLESGSYYVLFHINKDKRFTLKGLPAVSWDSNDYFNFDLKKDDQENGFIQIDKNNIKINGKNFFYRNPAPVIEPENNEIKVEFPIESQSNQDQEANIKYELSKWSQQDSSDILSTSQESKLIKANDTSNLSYLIKTDDPNESLYHLRITISTQNSKSISNIHIVVANRSQGMFDYLGFARSITNNALVPYFCVRDKHWTGNFEGKIELAFLDSKDQKIGDWEGQGFIEPNVRCFIVKNSKIDISNCPKIKGQIFTKEGKLVDQFLSDNACLSKNENSNEDIIKQSTAGEINPLDSNSKFSSKVLIIFVVIFLFSLMIYFYIKYYKKNVNQK